VNFKQNIKTIIVSATVDEDICKYLFGDDAVNFYECKSAQYIGTLNQYPSKSMSRADIKKDPTVFDRIQKVTGNDDIITFKKYSKGPLHFGNTDGRDIYKGKNIDVIGTPHQPEFMYKLLAHTLELNFDIDAKLIPNMLIEHNGYRFPFTTYEDEVLRNIQFWMIESELEQAVGRARLLREPCAVNLFSNLPLRQAQMIEMDY
jgi:ADP-glucose pyrophosphorylase